MTSDSSIAMEGAISGVANSYSQRTTLPAPWAQVVRGGGEPDPVPPRSPSASPSSVSTEQNIVFSDQLTVMEPQTAAAVETHMEGSEGSNNGNASGVKKSAWNKPSPNGVVDGTNTPVMGAASWPALSELTRPLPKSLSFPSESSSKPTSDGSVTVSQAPIILQPQQKPVKTNASHHSNQNHTHNLRQRSMKRGGGAGGAYNRPPPPPPPPMPPFPLFDMPYGSFVPAVLDSPVREQSPYNGNNFAPRPMGGVGPHSNAIHDHSSNRKRNNFGPRPREDGGLYLNNGHGGRRDHHDRDWRGPRSHGAIPHQMGPPPPPPPRGYMQQAHLGPAPFIAPQPMRPYGTPMGYEMAAPFLYVPTLPPEPYRGAPLLPRAAPPSMFIPVMDPSLSVLILTQIEYYFSDANLVKDNYLRSNMDEEGWVPVTLIAGFRRVQSLTSDIQMILNSLRDSTVVEVQGETVRRRNEWTKWVKTSNKFPADSSFHSPRAATDGLVVETPLQKLTLDESITAEKMTTDTNDAHNEADSSILANREINTGEQSMNSKSSTSSNQDL
ncbi:la-related protein 1C-like [Cynara cardunculus var. scolymus]|uniref:RNA-binding protein Lupus La n=1 Tax=Cynara cardunculus var. scolymus TaxID=59895 RepID=A0A103YES4_CYNCS|nr:la-related protein 1C-like [Cynara cardunculus var. scolymus]KVI07751.1 RNA-binding protein Lupus La [Cynara cardunculus var. scolymus]